jgi:hypothetical protein
MYWYIVRIDVSEESISSIIRMKRFGELVTTFAVRATLDSSQIHGTVR